MNTRSKNRPQFLPYILSNPVSFDKKYSSIKVHGTQQQRLNTQSNHKQYKPTIITRFKEIKQKTLSSIQDVPLTKTKQIKSKSIKVKNSKKSKNIDNRKPSFIKKQEINESTQQDQLQYQEISLLANAQIKLADFKKFYPQTKIEYSQKYRNGLKIPSQSNVYTYAIAYLQYLFTQTKQKRINDLKKQIIQCDFQQHINKDQQMKELIDNSLQFKRIALKIIRELMQKKNVYNMVLYYDIDNVITFLFQCLMLERKNKKSKMILSSTTIPTYFASCFCLSWQGKGIFGDKKDGPKIIIKLNGQPGFDIIGIQ